MFICIDGEGNIKTFYFCDIHSMHTFGTKLPKLQLAVWKRLRSWLFDCGPWGRINVKLFYLLLILQINRPRYHKNSINASLDRVSTTWSHRQSWYMFYGPLPLSSLLIERRSCSWRRQLLTACVASRYQHNSTGSSRLAFVWSVEDTAANLQAYFVHHFI